MPQKMTTEFNYSMVRACKGAPISCLVAIGLARQAVSLDWLVSVTGYTANVIRPALRYLREIGLIDQPGRGQKSGWVLSQSIPLMEIEELDESSDLRKKCVNLPTTTTTRYEENEGSHGSSSRSDQDLRKKCVNPAFNILKDAGVGEPTLSQLCLKEWVTVDYVRAHIEAGKSKGDDLALIIWRMKQGDPEPVQMSRQDDRYKYVTGALSEYVNH